MHQRYVCDSSPIEERLHHPPRTCQRHITRLETEFPTHRNETRPWTIFQGHGSRKGQIPRDLSHA